MAQFKDYKEVTELASSDLLLVETAEGTRSISNENLMGGVSLPEVPSIEDAFQNDRTQELTDTDLFLIQSNNEIKTIEKAFLEENLKSNLNQLFENSSISLNNWSNELLMKNDSKIGRITLKSLLSDMCKIYEGTYSTYGPSGSGLLSIMSAISTKYKKITNGDITVNNINKSVFLITTKLIGAPPSNGASYDQMIPTAGNAKNGYIDNVFLIFGTFAIFDIYSNKIIFTENSTYQSNEKYDGTSGSVFKYPLYKNNYQGQWGLYLYIDKNTTTVSGSIYVKHCNSYCPAMSVSIAMIEMI